MFSVSQKLDLKTKRLTFKKLRYITDEVFEDFRMKNFFNIEFNLGFIFMIALFYLRMWGHYVGQYILLYLIGVPVTKFEAHYYKVYVEYAAWNFQQELAVVSIGILSNTCIMLMFVGIAYSSKLAVHCFPRMFYKVI